ncbi:MAG: hypothetical protein J1D77_02805 [Muribaculaceae bacterium]|nr:hypothetical protein [Muribaculaceae bacterium]
MIGRLDGAVAYLLEKYNLSLNQSVSDWETLFMALSSRVDDYDRDFCIKLAQVAEGLVKESQNSSLNQFQIDHERTIGTEDASFVFNYWPDNYASHLMEDSDFSFEKNEVRRLKMKEIKRNILIGGSCIVMLVVAVIIYNLPFFAENREFAKVKDQYEKGSIEMLNNAVDGYLEKFPNGRHSSEVLFMPVNYLRNSKDVLAILDATELYIKKDPNGQYMSQCKALSDSIWDLEINRYVTIHSKSASEEGVKFVVAMLNYMKQNSVRTVLVKGKPHILLKEYMDYPSYVRNMWEMIAADRSTQKESGGKKLKLPDDMVTIKDKITEQEAAGWIKYIVSALQNGFNQVLTPEFIVFQMDNTPNITDPSIKQPTNQYPLVIVDYTVKNQEIEENVPDIWIHNSSYNNYVYSSNLFLGIALNFSAHFSLPGKNVNFEVEESGDAGNAEIKGVDNSSVYAVMCKRSTQNFATKIAQEFGLK